MSVFFKLFFRNHPNTSELQNDSGRFSFRFSGKNADLEKDFVSEHTQKSVPQVRFMLILAILFYGVFGIIETLTANGGSDDSWIARNLIFFLAIINILLLALYQYFSRYLQLLLAILWIFSGTGVIALLIFLPPTSHVSLYSTIILIFIFSCTLVRIRFLYACSAGMFVIAVYQIATFWSGSDIHPILFNYNFYFTSANLIAVFACYSLELSARRDFLLTSQYRKQTYELKKLTKAMETMHLGITISDPQGEIIYANDAVIKMHGYAPDEIQLKDFRQVVKESNPEPAVEPCVSQKAGWIRESSHVRKDGTVFPVRLISDVTYDETGEPLAIITLCEDITEIMQARQKLQEHQQRLEYTVQERTAELSASRKALKQERDLFVEGPVVTVKWQVDTTGRTRITYVSPNIRNFGISAQDLIQRKLNIWELVHQDDLSGVRNSTLSYITNRMPTFEMEFRILNPEGTEFWIFYRTTSHKHVRNPNIQSYHSFIIDLSEIKQMKKELQEKQALLVHSGRLASLGELATGVAHELNQPLTVILAQAEIFGMNLRDLGIVDKQTKEDLRVIREEVGRASEIIENMRGFARMTQDDFDPVDIAELLDRSLIFFRQQFKVHDVEFTVEIADNIPEIYLDPQRFMQIVVNCLSNARYAVDKRQKQNIDGYRKKIRLSCLHDFAENRLCLEISDNGTGMTEEELEHCQDPFFTTKEVGEGTGLGLSIVNTILREFNGCCRIRSEPDMGTAFKVFIPGNQSDPV